jgi:hypothetical protein
MATEPTIAESRLIPADRDLTQLVSLLTFLVVFPYSAGGKIDKKIMIISRIEISVRRIVNEVFQPFIGVQAPNS